MTQILTILLPFLSFRLAESCARTSGGGSTVTTTVSSITTTVAGATTTTASCTNCQIANFNTNQQDPNDPNDPIVHAATVAAGTPQNGCSTLVVTCTALPANGITSINLFAVGSNTIYTPDDPNNPTATSSATLVCNTSGQWQYQANPVSGASCSG